LWAGWAFGFAGGLVVAGGVDGELAEEFAGRGVDDADVQVVDEQDDVKFTTSSRVTIGSCLPG